MKDRQTLSLLIAALALIGSFLVPEVRDFFGIERRSVPTKLPDTDSPVHSLPRVPTPILPSPPAKAEQERSAPQALKEPSPNQHATADRLLRAAAADYIVSGNADSLDAEMVPYAQQVDYYNQGIKTQDEIRADLAKQRARWTYRQYTFSRVVRTQYDSTKDTGVAIVQYKYRVANGSKHQEAEAQSLLEFRSVTENPKVILVREQHIQ